MMRIGEIEIDQATRRVRQAGTEVHLTAEEYALFQPLVQHRGRVVSQRLALLAASCPGAQLGSTAS